MTTTFNVHSSTVAAGNGNIATYTMTSPLLFADPANPGAPISVYGQISTTNGSFTEYDGSVGGELLATGMSLPTASDLSTLGFPVLTSLALQDTNSAQASVTDTVTYSFSSPVPVGTKFLLWDPGSVSSSSSTFTFTGNSGTVQLQPSDFTLTAEQAFPGYPDVGTYATAGGSATLTVSNYVGGKTPEDVVTVVADKPLTSITLTAKTTGNDIFGLAIVSPYAAVTDTVVGAGGATIAMPMGDTLTGAVAQGLLSTMSADEAGGSLLSYLTGATAPTIAAGQGTLQEDDSTSLVALAPTDTALVDDSVTPVTAFGGTAANESIVSALGSLTFVAGSGSGTVVSGGGPSVFIAVAPAAGNFAVDYGAGNDVILAAVGNDTISAGGGDNLIWLGAGSDTIISQGADTIVGQAGVDTVWAGTTSDLVFGGTGGLDFIGGASTVANTVVGLGGALTIAGGAGGGFFFGAPAGGNQITGGSGNVTIFGGGSGDVLSAGSGSANDLLSGGPGAETLTGAASSGNDTFYGGYGPEQIYGGSGKDVFINGVGASTLYGGSAGNVFVFIDGRDYSPVTVNNFVVGRDFVSLQNFGTSADASTFASAVISGGSTTVTLPDTTQVTFVGVTNLTSGSFA
jgi:Ca2+-binding RTX toxin-like protein